MLTASHPKHAGPPSGHQPQTQPTDALRPCATRPCPQRCRRPRLGHRRQGAGFTLNLSSQELEFEQQVTDGRCTSCFPGNGKVPRSLRGLAAVSRVLVPLGTAGLDRGQPSKVPVYRERVTLALPVTRWPHVADGRACPSEEPSWARQWQFSH